MTLKVLSWNVNDLNSPRKHEVIFHWLKKQRCDIICLQETHVKKTDCKYLTNKSLGSDFYSLSKKGKKGIVFYINKDLQPKEIFVDNDGRYIQLEIEYERGKTLFLGIYAPNDSKKIFF